ncbi:MAG: hypothetical protein JWO50_655 [Candidatus Kaiserbacteria bacterium]|nr:hypothetical protein [Candidatus Kaiserbacteria bacterium]
MKSLYLHISTACLVLVTCIFLGAGMSHAQTGVPASVSSSIDSANSVIQQADAVSQIQAQIDAHHAQIQKIDSEISLYQQQLDATTNKKKTLQNTLSQISLTIKKTGAVISSTQEKIAATSLELTQLGGQITDKQQLIQNERAGLAESIRSLRETDSSPFVIQALSQAQISDAWRDADSATALHGAIAANVQEVNQQETQLMSIQNQVAGKKADLLGQKKNLQTQQGSLTATKNAQNTLLSQTKQQESAYQQLIAQKKAQEASFEDALSDLQSKLQVAVNSKDITKAGVGVLQWPVDHVIITQYFGNTAFAASGAYNGKGHNGIDLGVPIGTPIKAPLDGVILGTGNTDLVKGCYSFGKWVLIKHANGLDTMYGHLSQISVAEGDIVHTGDIIGYSGETGYATGPHLHFGVYVSSATQILKLGAATNQATPCASARMPVAPLAGYLNPLNYLPAKP